MLSLDFTRAVEDVKNEFQRYRYCRDRASELLHWFSGKDAPQMPQDVEKNFCKAFRDGDRGEIKVLLSLHGVLIQRARQLKEYG